MAVEYCFGLKDEEAASIDIERTVSIKAECPGCHEEMGP